MKDTTKHKIRALLVTAIAAVLNTTASAKDVTAEIQNTSKSEGDLDELKNQKFNRIYRNVLRIGSNGNTKLIAGHRSHMSHRSGGGGGGGGHRSHMSHYSSYSGGGSSHYSSSSSYGGSSRRTTSTPSYTPPPKPKVKTPGEYSLGDRKITNGIYGADVSSVATLLVDALYISRKDITFKDGYAVYDGKISAAVMHFQKDAGLTQNGIADDNTISKLRSWDSDDTTVALGIRELRYIEDGQAMRGTDVTELVTLLSRAGFPPDPKKIVTTSNGRTEFTKDIQTAVRFFQAYNHIKVTGIADEATIAKLKGA